MNSQIKEILHRHTEELNILLEAKTVEEALYGLISYLDNGLRILYAVVSGFEDKK